MKIKSTIIIVFIMASCAFFFSSFSQPFLPTSLKVKVIDSNTNVVKSAKVTLYGNELDYNSKQNPLFEDKLSNKDGIVVFENLTPMPYYIHALKGNISNMAEEILTETLLEGRVNTVTTLMSDD